MATLRGIDIRCIDIRQRAYVRRFNGNIPLIASPRRTGIPCDENDRAAPYTLAPVATKGQKPNG